MFSQELKVINVHNLINKVKNSFSRILTETVKQHQW